MDLKTKFSKQICDFGITIIAIYNLIYNSCYKEGSRDGIFGCH